MTACLWQLRVRAMPYNDCDWIQMGVSETPDLANRVAQSVRRVAEGRFRGGLDVEVISQEVSSDTFPNVRLEEISDYSAYIESTVEFMQRLDDLYERAVMRLR